MDQDNIKLVKKLCLTYTEAINRFSNNSSNAFDLAVKKIINSDNHIVVCGMGKSGHVGRKIAATLASTGSPSFFLHPAEAIHGDLGMVKRNDVVILISYSGETEEILKLINPLKNLNATIISFTGNQRSSLSKNSDIIFDISIDKEACPLNLAPTTSSMLTMVVGDALAITLMEARGFAEEDFALTHPGGNLGKNLNNLIKDKMVNKNLPLVGEDDLMSYVIIKMSEGRLGLAIVHKNNELKGIITDGDLRRLIQKGINFNDVKASDVMSHSPLIINENLKLIDAQNKMIESKVQALVVTNSENHISGVIQIY